MSIGNIKLLTGRKILAIMIEAESEVFMWRSKLPILVNRKEEQEQRRITQQEIAGATQLRQATISAWMNWGKFQYLNAAVVAALAEYFDCSPSELYEWVDNEQGEAVAVAVN